MVPIEWEVTPAESRRPWLNRCRNAAWGVLLGAFILAGTLSHDPGTTLVGRPRPTFDNERFVRVGGWTLAVLGTPLALAFLAVLAWPHAHYKYRVDPEGISLRRNRSEARVQWDELDRFHREGHHIWLSLSPEARDRHDTDAFALYMGDTAVEGVSDALSARLEHVPASWIGERRALA